MPRGDLGQTINKKNETQFTLNKSDILSGYGGGSIVTWFTESISINTTINMTSRPDFFTC